VRRESAAVALVVVVLALSACTGEPTPGPTMTDGGTGGPTTSAPTPTTPAGPTLDPAQPSGQFALPTGTQVTVNGVVVAAVDGTSGPGEPRASFTVSGPGIEEQTVWGELGQVAEIPGWGLLTVEEVEGDPVTTGGARPPTTLHFRAQTEAPLQFTSTFTLAGATGTLRITAASVEIRKDGAADGVVDLTVRADGQGETAVQGAVGTAVDVPGWGSLTVVAPEPGTAAGTAGPLAIRTVTAFPVVDESPR